MGVVSCLALMLEGVPSDGGIELSVSTESHSVTTNNCAKGCTEPETTDSKTTVTTSSPSEEGGQSALEKAFDNDAGVTLMRILFALVAAFATGVVVYRIVVGLIDGSGPGHGQSGPPAKIKPPPSDSHPGERIKPATREKDTEPSRGAQEATASAATPSASSGSKPRSRHESI